MIRLLLSALVLAASPGLTADKPAALLVCVQLPAGVPLFSAAPAPNMKSLGNDTWMLDLDFTLDGRPPERISKSGADCFRAWLPAQHLEHVAFDFSRLPLNLVNQDRAIDVQLKADLWSDGGKFVIERAPWSVVRNETGGTLTLTRSGVVMTDWQQLPRGSYLLDFNPPAEVLSVCPISLHVVGLGTVRADRQPELYRELVESYRRELLPLVVAQHKLQCEPAETAQVSVRLVDGIFRNPLEPVIARVRLEAKERQYQLSIDGQVSPFVSGQKLVLEPGQQLELSERSLHAVR